MALDKKQLAADLDALETARQAVAAHFVTEPRESYYTSERSACARIQDQIDSLRQNVVHNARKE